jgi:hypothetical protein
VQAITQTITLQLLRKIILCNLWLFFILGQSNMAILMAQGPLDGYMKGRKKLDLAPSFSLNNASTFYGANQSKYNETYKGQLLSMFAAYGVTDRFDLVATGSFVFTTLQSGLQDGGLFVKYRPIYADLKKQGKLSVIFGTGANFPLSDYEPTATGALGQKAISVPARLITQWETKLGLFINLTAGYNWRIDELKEADVALIRKERPNYEATTPPDFSTVLVKIGFPAAHYYLDAWVERQYTKGGVDYMPSVLDLPQAYGVTYTQIGGTAYYSKSGKRGIFVSGGYILNGRNTSGIRRLTLGAVFKY